MRIHTSTGLLAAAALAWSGRPAHAQGAAASPATIVAQGNGRGAPACVSCHGPRMEGLADKLSPRLAGQNAAYLETQLEAFATGARKNATMQPVAGALSAAERQALASYLASLIPAPAESAAAPAAAATLALGKLLATRGRWSSGLPSCDRCHGPAGIGVGATFPPLAGQTAIYVANQLRAYRDGTRPAGPLALMRAIASRMTDADIAAAAAYYATLPPTPPTVAAGRNKP